MSDAKLQQARDKLLVEIGWGMVDVMKSLNRNKMANSLAETTAAFDDLQSTGGKRVMPSLVPAEVNSRRSPGSPTAEFARHDLYVRGDANIPPQICDSNGCVVLAQCRICGKAEIELDQSPFCPGPTPL